MSFYNWKAEFAAHILETIQVQLYLKLFVTNLGFCYIFGKMAFPST